MRRSAAAGAPAPAFASVIDTARSDLDPALAEVGGQQGRDNASAPTGGLAGKTGFRRTIGRRVSRPSLMSKVTPSDRLEILQSRLRGTRVEPGLGESTNPRRFLNRQRRPGRFMGRAFRAKSFTRRVHRMMAGERPAGPPRVSARAARTRPSGSKKQNRQRGLNGTGPPGDRRHRRGIEPRNLPPSPPWCSPLAGQGSDPRPSEAPCICVAAIWAHQRPALPGPESRANPAPKYTSPATRFRRSLRDRSRP